MKLENELKEKLQPSIDRIDKHATNINNEAPKIRNIWMEISPTIYVKASIRFILNSIFDTSNFKLSQSTGFTLHKRLLNILVDFDDTKIPEILINVLISAMINKQFCGDPIISNESYFMGLNALVPYIVKTNYSIPELSELLIAISLLSHAAYPTDTRKASSFVRKVVRKKIVEDEIGEQIIHGIVKQKGKVVKKNLYGTHLNLNESTINLIDKMKVNSEEIINDLKQTAIENKERETEKKQEIKEDIEIKRFNFERVLI